MRIRLPFSALYGDAGEKHFRAVRGIAGGCGFACRGIGWHAGQGVFGEAPAGFGKGCGDRFAGRSGEHAEDESVARVARVVRVIGTIAAVLNGSFRALFPIGAGRGGRGHWREFERNICAGLRAWPPGKTLERENVRQGNEILERRRVWEIRLKDRLDMVCGLRRIGENCLRGAAVRKGFHLARAANMAGDARVPSDWS